MSMYPSWTSTPYRSVILCPGSHGRTGGVHMLQGGSPKASDSANWLLASEVVLGFMTFVQSYEADHALPTLFAAAVTTRSQSEDANT